MRLKTMLTALTVGAALAAGAPAAFAQSPSEEGYGEPAGAVQTQLNGSGPAAKTETAGAAATTQNAKTSGLPFTGLDVALIVGAGGVLLLLGFGMRRLSRPNEAI
jgi:hypothetical protein